MKKIHSTADSRLDKFYDETPKTEVQFQMKVSNRNEPFAFTYVERLDGTPEENKQVMSRLQERAQADMYNALLRLQAKDEDCEFVSWQMLDRQGVILINSDTLNVKVK